MSFTGDDGTWAPPKVQIGTTFLKETLDEAILRDPDGRTRAPSPRGPDGEQGLTRADTANGSPLSPGGRGATNEHGAATADRKPP